MDTYQSTKIQTVPFRRKRDLRGLKKPTLSGHKLQLITDVKYRGLNLDKGLTQMEQLERT